MPISADFTINTTAKTVTHSSGTEVYTVEAFYLWLASTFSASDYMDDAYPFTADTPTVYRWKNGWDMGDDTSYQFLKGGSILTSTGSKLFSNIYTLGEQYRNSMIYIIQNSIEITPFWSPGNIDVLIKVKDTTLIDNGIVWMFSRDTDCLYDHNSVNLSGGGRNPVGVNTFTDNNYLETGDIYLSASSVTDFDVGNYVYGNTSTATGRIQYVDSTNSRLYLCQIEGTFSASETIYERITRTGTNGSSTTSSGPTNVVAGYTDISITFGDTSEDLLNGNGSQPYKVSIDCNGRTVKQVYQYLKYITRHNSSTTINGDSGEEYRSAIHGTYNDSKQAPFGTFAGGKFFGARGVWIENMAGSDANSYQLIDANNISQAPPNTVATTITVQDLATGLDIEGANVLVWVTNNANYFYQALVSITGVGTTATVTHNTHGLSTGEYVIIKGVTNDDDYNGVYQITVSNENQYTYTATETLEASSAEGTSITSTFAIINGATNSSGIISDSRSLNADQPVAGWVRKSSDTPYYQQGTISGTIDSDSGLSVTLQLARDE
jgi:hypothetical protein